MTNVDRLGINLPGVRIRQGQAKSRLDQSINELRAKDGLGPMPHWRIHDPRRTMVTMMNEKLAIPPHIVEAVVNHISGLAKAGVAGVYNRALYLEDRRTALNAWSDSSMAIEFEPNARGHSSRFQQGIVKQTKCSVDSDPSGSTGLARG